MARLASGGDRVDLRTTLRIACLLGLLMTGCEITESDTGLSDRFARPDADLPTYRQIVDRYNENIKRVDRLWARMVVELRWKDKDGRHFEQGEGNLIAVLPDRVAMSIGKLGHTMMWLGGDHERYWFFDLREQESLYTGRHDQVERLDPDSVPVPIRPQDLPRLLGLEAIDPERLPSSPAVEWYDGKYLIEPPGMRARLLIDPETARPARIDLFDPTGRSRVVGRLSQWELMRLDGLPPGAFPRIATRLEISLVDKEGRATFYLSDLSDGEQGNRIKDKAFDLTHLRSVFKPKRIVDLDQR